MSQAAPRSGPPSRLPARSRDKRPALAALALLLVLLGALGSALIAYRSGERVDVLVASREIPQGSQVTREDFTVARIAQEGAQVVGTGSLDSFVGSYATSRVPEGTVVSAAMFTLDDVVPAGGQLVGVTVGFQNRPSTPLTPGDIVRVYAVPPAEQAGTAVELVSEEIIAAAKVVDVTGSATTDTVHMTLLVPDATADKVVQLSAGGLVAVTELPRSTTPLIDLRTE